MKKLTLIFLIFSVALLSQGKKYEFAKSYLDNGQYEDAARLFGELYKENPKNPQIIEGLLSSYYAMNKYSEMIEPLKKYSDEKSDPSLGALLGDIYWKTSQPELAKETWNKTLKKYDDNITAFSMVANAQNLNRLFGDAIDTYLKARNSIGDKSIFTDELIKSYISIGDYKNGTSEVIAALNTNRSIPTAQGRLYALMASDGAEKYIGEYLEKLANSNSDNLTYQELLAWFYSTTNNFKDAFEVYKRLDDLRNRKGGVIYKFAEEARRDENFQPAIDAYEYIIDNPKKYDRYFRNALLGYARSLESGLAKSDSLDFDKLERIIERYEDIIDDDQRSNLAEEAYFRIASIYKDQYQDHKKAIENFEKVIEIFKTTPKAAYSAIEIGDIYLMNNKIEESQEKYRYVIEKLPKTLENPRNLASYKLAVSYFYQGNSDETLKYLSPLTTIQDQNIANDALELTYLIGENKEFPGAADSLGIARYYDFSAKTPKDTLKADLAYRDIHKNFAATPAAEKAFQFLSEMYFSENPEKTIEVIDQFLYLYPTSILVDEILILKAKSYEKLDDVAEAQSIYSKILVDHPNSIYLQEARDSIRRLRGEL